LIIGLAAEAVVRAKAMNAPEAARLYALNTIALHDNFMAVNSKSGYLAHQFRPSGPPSLTSKA